MFDAIKFSISDVTYQYPNNYMDLHVMLASLLIYVIPVYLIGIVLNNGLTGKVQQKQMEVPGELQTPHE